MRNWVKRVLSIPMSAALLTGALCTGATAFAAAQPQANFAVELDGEPINFPASALASKEGRNFVAAEDLFKALGAEVTSKDGKVVSAKRNGITVTMTDGEKSASIQQGDVISSIPMDVAAYVEGGKLYAPIRFAGQAMGCIVGWDNDDRTVILVDAVSLGEDAIAQNKYTLLEKYNTYAKQFNEDNWKVDMEMAMTMSVLTAQIVGMEASSSGVTANGTAGQLDMDMTMDMSGLAGLVTLLMGASEAEAEVALGVPAEEFVWDISMDMRMDLEDGKVYMLMSGLPEEAGLPKDTWLCMDMDTIYDELETGIDFSELMKMESGDMDPSTLLVGNAGALELNDKDTAYQTVQTVVDTAAAALSDDAFKKEGLVYTNTLDTDFGSVSFQLTTNQAGDVVGYNLTGDLAVKLEELDIDMSELTQLGIEADRIQVEFDTGMDEKNAMSLQMSLTMGELMAMEVTSDGQYTSTKEEPETSLPKGAKVIDYVEWLESVGV